MNSEANPTKETPGQPPVKTRTPQQIAKRIRYIIGRAYRMGKVRDGVVICDNCETPASRSLSMDLGWTACAPCVWGEADSFDEEDTINVRAEKKARRANG